MEGEERAGEKEGRGRKGEGKQGRGKGASPRNENAVYGSIFCYQL